MHGLKSEEDAENKAVKVTLLQLPTNTKMYNTGASLERWCQKRPRLKSTKKADKSSEKSQEGDTKDEKSNCDESNFNDNNDLLLSLAPFTDHAEQFSPDQELDDPFQKFEYDGESNEVDDDVEKLINQFIQNATNNDSNAMNKPSKRKKRKRHQFSKKESMTRTKLKKRNLIRIKPPSPSTLEVIRVDVTSNYYQIDDPHSDKDDNGNNSRRHDCIKGHGKRYKYSFVLATNKLNEKNDEYERDLEIECKKLVLGSRKSGDKSKTIA